VFAEVVKLSVVVPFHNVERYIEASLESIARQTLRDIQVIMVDDGSADGSTVIAKNFAARDPRFELVQQQNQGLGPARNTGAARATGQYLAFADSDDLLDPHAYELLTGSLDRTGSDMASGAVTRFGPLGPTPSWLHEDPFRSTLLRTHVSQLPTLLQDRTAWNKVFRRAFWDAHEFKFPAGLYEDGPVVLRAYVLASSVDIFSDVVYYWRVRESGGLSITQRAREPRNIEQRMASVGSVAGFLATHAPALKPFYDRSVLKGDIAMLVSACELASEPEREGLAALAAEYLSHVGEAAYQGVPAIKRLHCYLLAHGMMPELLEVLRFSRRGDVLDAPVVHGGSRGELRCAAYPFFRDPARGIPDEVYDVTSEMTLEAFVDAVAWRGGKLRVEGAAYIRQLSSGTPDESQIRVTLRNTRTRRTIKLPVERVCRPDVTARSGQGAVSYDWSGFAVEVDPHRLATLPGVWRAANWELMVQVSGAGMRRKGPITNVRPGSAQWPEGCWAAPGVWVQPAPEHDGRFVIRGQRVTAFVASCQASETTIDFEGWTTFPLSPGAELLIAPRKGGVKTIRVAAEVSSPGAPAGRSVFRAQIPVSRLIIPKDAATALDQAAQAHDEFTWDVSISPGPGTAATRLAASSGVTGTRLGSGGREVTAFVTHFGYLSLLERTARPVVTDLEWTSAQHLVLRGTYSGPGDTPSELILRHNRSDEQYAVPLTWVAGMFTTELDPSAMPGPAGAFPLITGNWQLLAPTGLVEMAVAVHRDLLPVLPGYHRAGLHDVEAQPYRTDALRLSVRTALDDDERGRYAQSQLSTRDYPAAATQPLRDLAVFDSFSGRHYSCNPRAIYEELRRSHPDVECVWVTEEDEFTVPDNGRMVLTGSREHYAALAQARYIVFNDTLPRWFRKREGQTCVQTWHGTPLKRIGLDVDRPQFASGLIYPDLLRADVAHWDLLLSPNEFSTPIFRRAFGYDGEIMESGYPRNDPLHRPGQAERAAAIRARLGLPEGKRVVLYAPTWRDDADRDQGIYRFDLQLDTSAAAAALGDDHVLLVRLHTKAQCNLPQDAGGFVTDVTHYPDITDLYLISDVLITDYSSVMFDFAGTGRPMLFFTYDLERYRDTLRGFYFDFEAEAPGPLLRTTGDVIDALRGLDGVASGYRAAYEAFTGKYCALDDGQAAARVVRRLLKSE
jgi:CDP-glycerol glycerophosphotransferase